MKIDTPKTVAEWTEPAEEAAVDDTLGGRIVRAREAAGLSTIEIAEQLGVDEATVTAWESDRSEPRSHRLVTLAGLVQVSPTWLIVGHGEAPAEDNRGDELDRIRGELAQLKSLHNSIGDAIDRIGDQVARLGED